VNSKIKQAFHESAAVKLRFIEKYESEVAQVARILIEALRADHKVLLFGNGGSATDASHLAAELVNRFAANRRALPALALATDMSVMTSISNDYDFSEVFARQIEAFGRAGDVAVAISTSGNSPNVLKGVETARRLGLITVGFTGGSGGRLAGAVAHAFIVPSTVTARIQETHITLGHTLCALVEEAFCG
jgi:D-sedoheptulose 7-phosphate isomerase